MANSKLILISFALAAAVIALPKLISIYSQPDGVIVESSSIEQMIEAAFLGSRFDELDIEIKDCTLKVIRTDSSICSITDGKSGIFEIEEYFDLSKLDGSSISLGNPRDVGGVKITRLRINYDQEFVEAVEVTRAEYSEFLNNLTKNQREDPTYPRISPFFEGHDVSNLPAYRISRSCRSGGYLSFKGQSHPIFISGPNVESAPSVFASTIRSCHIN